MRTICAIFLCTGHPATFAAAPLLLNSFLFINKLEETASSTSLVEWHNYIGASNLQYPSIEFVIMYLESAVLIQTNIPVKRNIGSGTRE